MDDPLASLNRAADDASAEERARQHAATAAAKVDAAARELARRVAAAAREAGIWCDSKGYYVYRDPSHDASGRRLPGLARSVYISEAPPTIRSFSGLAYRDEMRQRGIVDLDEFERHLGRFMAENNLRL